MNRLQMAVQLVLISLVLSLTACGGADKALAERAGYYKATNVVQKSLKSCSVRTLELLLAGITRGKG